MVKSSTVTVVVNKINTSLSISLSKTSGAPLDWIKITGKLTRDDTGAGLGGKTVTLWVNGIKEKSTTTASDGSYKFDWKCPEEGRYDIYTHFDGDVTFWPCDSPLRTFTASKLSTSITIDVSPTRGDAPLKVKITGKIMGEDKPIAVPIELYINGEKVDEKFSNSDGSYSFTYTFETPGRFDIYTEFKGNVRYRGCEAWPW